MPRSVDEVELALLKYITIYKAVPNEQTREKSLIHINTLNVITDYGKNMYTEDIAERKKELRKAASIVIYKSTHVENIKSRQVFLVNFGLFVIKKIFFFENLIFIVITWY